MKKLFSILSLVLLVGCGTPGAYHSIQISPGQYKASVTTWDGGWGYTKAHATEEAAIFAAFRTCIGAGNATSLCELDYINSRQADYYEKQKWKSKFLRDQDKYEYVREDGFWLAKLKKGSSSSTRVAKKTTSKGKSSTKSKGSSGSAFFVTNRGHIITNYHVVQNCRSTPQIKYKDKDVVAKILAKDQLLDLALLKANLTNTKYVTLSKDQPKKLQRIIASGYPFGKYISDDLKFTSGIVSSLKGPNDDSTLVQVDAALNPGNSGGPIVDEETGKLVAVSVMGMKKSISEGQNFGIKTSSVRNFLESNQVKVPSSWFKSADVAKLLEESTLYTYCR